VHIAPQPSLYCALVAASLAAYTDWRYGKVYNWLTVPAALLGFVLGYIGEGLPGLAMCLLGLAAGFGLAVLAVFVGAPFGGGDTKLLCALGALGGPVFLLRVAAAGILASGVLALLIALRRGVLAQAGRNLLSALSARVAGVQEKSLSGMSSSATLPFAVGIAVGVWVVVVFGGGWLLGGTV